jgi:hypothetical protein
VIQARALDPPLCLALSLPWLRRSRTLPSALAICPRISSPSGRSLPMRRSIDVLYAPAACAALRTALSPDLASTVPGWRCTRSHLVSHRTRHTDALIPFLISYPSSYFPSPPRNPDSSLFVPAPCRAFTYAARGFPSLLPAFQSSPALPSPLSPHAIAFYLSYLISLILHHRSTQTSPIYLDTLVSKIRYPVTQSVPELIQFNSYIPSLLPSATHQRLEIDSRFPAPPYDCGSVPTTDVTRGRRARALGPCFVPRSLPSFAPPLQHSPLCPRNLSSLSLPVWPLIANATTHRRAARPRWLRRLRLLFFCHALHN